VLKKLSLFAHDSLILGTSHAFLPNKSIPDGHLIFDSAVYSQIRGWLD
jgi:hypothetical protein